MTSTASSSTSSKAEFAAYLADRLLQAGHTNPSSPISAAMIEGMISDFERAGNATGQRRLSLVSESDQLALATAEKESKAVAETLRGALAPDVIAAAGEQANDPGMLASLVVEENKDMQALVQAGNLVLDMHRDLVQMLGEMLPRLEQANFDRALLLSARALLNRAQAIQEGRGIPAGVSPIRILTTIERVSSAHHDILMRFGNVLDKQTLVRGIRVVGEAAKLLEEIHGPVREQEAEDDDAKEQRGQRM